MAEDFYDKVAKKFGGYAFGKGHVKRLTEYPNGDPEKVFKEKIIDLAGKSKVALDVGCGDGKFTFQMSKYFSKIIGIDTSSELLKIARVKKNKLRVKNVVLRLQNARETKFPDKTFDVIYCRRGPTFYNEYSRIVKDGGYCLEIGIGEKDTIGLKKIFGRGQGYNQWGVSRLEKDIKNLENSGFKVIFAENYYYDEFYFSQEDLDTFLQSVPIFEDYDSLKDKKYLERYIEENKKSKRINLPRHRIVIAALKK